MNPTKAAAIIALIVTVVAAVYLAYQAAFVRARYESNTQYVEACQAQRDADFEKWQQGQAKIDGLINEGKYDEARAAAIQHEQGKPIVIAECDAFRDMRPPIYAWPTGITIVGLITSLVLFGAAKPKQMR